MRSEDLPMVRNAGFKIIFFFLVVLGALISAPGARANDIYFAQNASGAANGADCADAYAYNDGTHGINVASNWVPGNTLHICGTITFPLNSAGIIAQASGTSGSPITVYFEPGAIIQSPAFNGCGDGPGSGSSSAGGGIEVRNFNYIIIDGGLNGSGGPNGIIQNTANGTNLANQQCSAGIWEHGDYNIVRNIIIQNIYQQSASSTSTAGASSTSLVQDSANFTMVCNSVFNNSGYGVELNYGDSVYTPATTLPNCQSNTYTAHTLAFFNNTISDHGWMIHGNGTGAPLLYNNEITNWSNYFLTSIHTHGFFFTGFGRTVFAPQVFWNYVHGDLRGTSPTGLIYLTDDGTANSGYGQSANIYGNVFYGQGATVTCCQGIATWQTSGDPKGPYKFYNNTIVNSLFMVEQYSNATSPTVDWRNNVWYGQSGSYFYHNENSPYTFSTGTFNGSDYYGGRALPFGLYQGPNTFSVWKANCVTGGGTLCDASSVTTDPVLAGEASFVSGGALTGAGFYPQATSGARGIGDNLTSQCSTLVGLCTSAPQTFGAGGRCGTGCVARPSSGAWDAGAYAYTSTTSGAPAAPQGLSASVN